MHKKAQSGTTNGSKNTRIGMDQLLRYDHYKVLGVPRDASTQQIKRAYRERVKQCHPDRNGAANAAQVFQAVHDAYNTLIHVESRTRYDEQLRFYREATEPPIDPYRYRSSGFRRQREEEPDRPVHRFAFFGLHFTGLLFGVALVMGILIGISFFQWPLYTLFFSIPGLAVIPDSISGLRLK